MEGLGLHAFTMEGQGSIPGRGTKIPQATQCGQNQPTNQPSFLKTTLKQNKISLLQLKLQYENSINQLYDSISDAIYSLDDLLHSIIIQEKTINLQQKKIEVSKAELKTGNIKRVDYLEDLINLASYKIQLLDEKFNAQNQIRTLEIITYIPLGELENVCKNQKF